MEERKIGGKLHQLLAVDGDLKGTYEKILNECRDTFGKRSEHFQGHEKTYQPLNAEDQDIPSNDIKHIVDTVPSKLRYIQGAVIKHLDALYQKELANTNAKADLELDGRLIAQDVPATVLLNLETKLKEIRSVYEAAPTYDPSKRWTKMQGETDTYITAPVKTVRTRKVVETLVLVPPTKEHPGQAQAIQVDRNAGEWSAVHTSGALSPADKSRLLGRIDDLIQAVKRARQKANDQDVTVVNIGKALFEYIHG